MNSGELREGRMIFELRLEHQKKIADKQVDTVANRLNGIEFVYQIGLVTLNLGL